MRYAFDIMIHIHNGVELHCEATHFVRGAHFNQYFAKRWKSLLPFSWYLIKKGYNISFPLKVARLCLAILKIVQNVFTIPQRLGPHGGDLASGSVSWSIHRSRSLQVG